MPTVLRFNGLRVVIYPNDHAPAHVHVIGDGCEALFSVETSNVELLENYGFAERRLGQIRTNLVMHQADLREAWRQIHGY